MILMKILGRASAQFSVQSTVPIATLGGTLSLIPSLDKRLLHSSQKARTAFHCLQQHLLSQNYSPVAMNSLAFLSTAAKSNNISTTGSISIQQSRQCSPLTSPNLRSSSVKVSSIAANFTTSSCCSHGTSELRNAESGQSQGKGTQFKEGLLSKDQADDFVRHLTDEQKRILYHCLNIEVLRGQYEGHLGSTPLESANYLSRFGRPTAAIIGGKEDADPTSKWLHTRLVSPELSLRSDESDDKVLPVTAKAVWAVGLKNAMPFIGFGFLDNLIMILAGDYIDLTIGAALGISTMAAAALGNTISDVAGIASAWYVEALAEKVGIHDPKLTPGQWNTWRVRWASNIGRAVGVVIGCLLGMVPLIFLPSAEEKKEREENAQKEKALKDAKGESQNSNSKVEDNSGGNNK